MNVDIEQIEQGEFERGEIEQKYNEYWEIIQDFRKYAGIYLKIKDENGNIIPFHLNEMQEMVVDILEKKRIKGEPIRLIILKCRQTGISTLIEAYLYWRTNIEFNQKALIIGHEKEASINLFDMYQRFYENLPVEIQPKIDTNQRERKLSYAGLKNEIIVQTAGANIDSVKAGTGRSGTYQYIHATEASFYPDYKTTFLGLLQASKKAKMIVIETTANGYNDFRNDWVDAINGLTDYIPIFLSWTKFKEYQKPLMEYDKERIERDLGANSRYNSYVGEEDNLIKTHNCTLEQINWRRWAIDNLCKGDVESFHQEYPTTWEEAFISSGRPVFDMEKCHKNYDKAKEPLRIGDFIAKYENNKIKEVEFVENNKGLWKIWEDISIEDEDQNTFAAGFDVAEGLAQGDYSAGSVLDRRTNKVCITFHGHIDADLLAEEQDKLRVFLKDKIYFNTEVNNHGLTTVTEAYKRGIKQYYRQSFEKGYAADKNIIGFKTTSQTKPFMINDLNEWIREDLFEDSEKEFWNECITFTYNDKGQMSAKGKDKDVSTKCYDDRVISRALMIVCHKWMPPARKIIKEKQLYARSFMNEINLTETVF